MNTQKFFSSLFVLILTCFAVTTAQAQNAEPGKDAAAWKRRVADQIATGLRTPPTTAPATPEVEASAAAEKTETETRQSDDRSSEHHQEGESRSKLKNALIGTWDVVLNFSDGSKIKATMSIIPGRSEGEGIVVHSAEASLIKPFPSTAEQGVWEHKGRLRFVASYASYGVDETFAMPAARIVFKHNIVVSSDQESFVGKTTIEFRDLEGKVLFSDTPTTTGQRQHAEAP